MALLIIHQLYLVPILISAILSLKAFRLKWPYGYRIFSVLLFTALGTEIIARLWKFWLYKPGGYSMDNAWIYTASLIPQYVLFMLTYYYALQSKALKKAIICTMILFSVFVVINAVAIQKFKVNSNAHFVADIIMILLAFAYFDQVRRDKEIYKLSSLPMVWISLGNLVYHLLNVPFLVSMNYLNITDRNLALSIFYFYLLFVFVSYVFYSRAYICKTPPK